MAQDDSVVPLWLSILDEGIFLLNGMQEPPPHAVVADFFHMLEREAALARAFNESYPATSAAKLIYKKELVENLAGEGNDVVDQKRSIDLNRRKLNAARACLESSGTIGRSVLEYCEYLIGHLGPQVLNLMSDITDFGGKLLKYHEIMDFGVRLVFYPEHPPLATGSIRCGEHVDSSTFTIVLQDDVGGLQIKQSGQWNNLCHRTSVILGVVGDILTNHRLQAVPHRVVDAPVNSNGLVPERVSIVVFMDADPEKVLLPHLYPGEMPQFRSDLTKAELKRLVSENNTAPRKSSNVLEAGSTKNGSELILEAQLLPAAVANLPAAQAPTTPKKRTHAEREWRSWTPEKSGRKRRRCSAGDATVVHPCKGPSPTAPRLTHPDAGTVQTTNRLRGMTKLLIDGNIGSGKSTVAQALDGEGHYVAAPEPIEFGKWCHFQDVQADPGRFAEAFQMDVLRSLRERDLQMWQIVQDAQHHATQSLTLAVERGAISAVAFLHMSFKNGILAKAQVDPLLRAATEFQQEEGTVLLYLKCSSAVCLQRIRQRGRLGEERITLEYLDEWRLAFEKHVLPHFGDRVITVDTTDLTQAEILREVHSHVLKQYIPMAGPPPQLRLRGFFLAFESTDRSVDVALQQEMLVKLFRKMGYGVQHICMRDALSSEGQRLISHGIQEGELVVADGYIHSLPARPQADGAPALDAVWRSFAGCMLPDAVVFLEGSTAWMDMQPPLHGDAPDSWLKIGGSFDGAELDKTVLIWMSRQLFQRQAILQWQDGPRARKRERHPMLCECKHTWVKMFPSGPRDNGEVYFTCSACGLVED